MDINIYQIFYNAETKNKLLPGFIPLDNTNNLRPDWYEFSVILDFLNANKLNNDDWYGFLSPKFIEKTGINSDIVIKIIQKNSMYADVALFSPGWDQLSYFLNPFEQGDVWHPGLLDASQKIFDEYGLDISLSKLVCDTTSSVFSNFIIAKKKFWEEWKKLSQFFYDYCENHPDYQVTTSYGSSEYQAPLKTFIQERFASVILSTNNFNVISIDQSYTTPLFNRLYPENLETRKFLHTCDLMKKLYRETKDANYLKMYWEIRSRIKYTSPIN